MKGTIRVKEKGEKNHKTKGMSKKRVGIESKSILKCTAQKMLNINFNKPLIKK